MSLKLSDSAVEEEKVGAKATHLVFDNSVENAKEEQC